MEHVVLKVMSASKKKKKNYDSDAQCASLDCLKDMAEALEWSWPGLLARAVLGSTRSSKGPSSHTSRPFAVVQHLEKGGSCTTAIYKNDK